METLIFEAPDKEKAKALLQVAKVLGISVVTSNKKAKPKAEKPYNPEFVAMLDESIAQIERGEVHKIDLEEFWK